MADFLIGVDDTDGIVFSTADSTLTLPENITLSNAGIALDASSLANNRSIFINGTVKETAGNGFRGSAIVINGDSSAVIVAAAGLVESERVGIKLTGDSSSLDITGKMTTGSTGVTMDGESSVLSVSGKLLSSTTAIVLGDGFVGQTITNSGLIRGDKIGFSLLGEGELVNQEGGVITGPDNFGSDVRQVIINRGTINGDIFLEGGNDSYDGRGGTLNGRVFGGVDSDFYIVGGGKTQIREKEDEGNDTVLTNVTYTLGDNIEQLRMDGKKDVNGFGNGLDNVLQGNSGNNRLEGRGGDDLFLGLEGADFFSGGTGADTLDYSFADGVIVNLETGKGKKSDAAGDRYSGIENILGSGFDDHLIGNGKKNELSGSSGDDILTGGAGRDTFSIASGGDNDTITDFEDGKDLLQILRFGEFSDIESFDDFKDFITEVNGDTIIDLGTFSEGVTVRLEKTEAAELDASDFIF